MCRHQHGLLSLAGSVNNGELSQKVVFTLDIIPGCFLHRHLQILSIPCDFTTQPLMEEDEKVVKSVVAGTIPSYSLESKLGDCKRVVAISREVLQRITGKSLTGLPLEGFDYESILGQCCEMPVRYVQIPVGIARPLMLNGREFYVPITTTEGCLVAGTNRGCKAINLSDRATSVLLRDGMTREPCVRFNSTKRAAELKFYLEDPKEEHKQVCKSTGTPSYRALASSRGRRGRGSELQDHRGVRSH
ncbi:hypothetical protein ACFX14_013295 [Malus domestica]